MYSLFVKNDGTVWGCGQNWAGELGNGTLTNTTTPVQSTSLSGIIAVAAGKVSGASYGNSLFLKNDGTVWGSGYNAYGELGNGTTNQQDSPVQSNLGACTVSTGIEENSIANNISIYPNPTTGIVNITTSINGVQLISVTNMLGEVVLSKEINLVVGSPFTIDISGEPAGIYLLRIGNSTQRIVKC